MFPRGSSVFLRTRDVLLTRDALLQQLGVAQRQRGKRLDWIEHERLSMLEAVNKDRLALGKMSVSVVEIERVERMALGHSDYSLKFALYCAELVHQ